MHGMEHGLLISAGFLFGLIIGSFLNVLVLRRGTGRALSGRSACLSCGKTLEWFELIPVFSWVALRGRCRGCGSAVSLQYPLVELSTGLLFALVIATGLPPSALIASLPMLALLVAIAAYDMRHTIIPDSWVYLFGACALLVSILSQSLLPFGIMMHVVLGLIPASPLFLLWFVSGGRWMGLGDAKLALGIGWLLGPVLGLYAVFFSFIIGAVVSVCILIPLPKILSALARIGITRLSGGSAGFTIHSEVPFGPFLIASLLLIWFSHLFGVALPVL
jgi:prepilin signal peptidase PulO-like enzyme (type II secretory pathway)